LHILGVKPQTSNRIYIESNYYEYPRAICSQR